MTASPPPHLLIRGARIYDGTGGPSFIADVRVAGGVITEIGPDLAAPDLAAPDDMGATIIEAQGRWLMPGLLDIHTHFDLEAEIAPLCPKPCAMAQPRWLWRIVPWGWLMAISAATGRIRWWIVLPGWKIFPSRS